MDSAWIPSSFSLVRGGLLYRLERHSGLIPDQGHGEASLGVGRRILVFWCLTWFPIMFLETLRLSKIQGINPDFALYFDLRMNVRFLFSAPLLIASEILIDRRLARVLTLFENRGIVGTPRQLASILSKASRWISGAPGIWVESGLLALVASEAVFGVTTKVMGPLRAWRALSPNGGIPFPVAWYLWVALPLFRFLQLRWLWRFAVWTGILWKLSRARLNLFASHPDQAGGIGFVAYGQESFALLWIAFSAGAASTVAFQVAVRGISLKDYYSSILAFVGLETLLLLAPLAFFAPQLAAIRRKGLRDYGRLSIRYVGLFDQKWMGNDRDAQGEQLLGSSDFQSLADLGTSFERVSNMRIFPAGKSSATKIILAGLLPFLFLAFLVMPIEQVFLTAIKFLF